MVKMATIEVDFSFNGMVYKQINSICIGFPLGPILANIFVGYYKRKLFKSSVDSNMCIRYIDDTFVIFKNSECNNELFLFLYNVHPFLKYTKKDERQNTTSFLDVRAKKVMIKESIQLEHTENQNYFLVLSRGLRFSLRK